MFQGLQSRNQVSWETCFSGTEHKQYITGKDVSRVGKDKAHEEKQTNVVGICGYLYTFTKLNLIRLWGPNKCL